ncbi:DUF4431 domain-containing protein [Pseudoalteromonas rubra]|uniref:DUF4431 domain-containing protein n=1 Tax=Pseudoalteromonas rubra TaxID=43658 RepID=UPI000F7835B8|nr:DUF4431 domain-containing protein [Pseudoalteromonas rubra]
MKYLALVMALVSFDTFSIMATNGTKVTVSGIIVLSEVHIEGKLINFKAIKLEQEQCFKADGIMSDKEQCLSTLQLVIPNTISLNLGQRYSLIGDAFHWHTAHHFTKVLFSVSSAKKL